jgi:hypothetical protein
MGVSGKRHDPAAVYPQRKNHGTHCIGGWVGLSADPDTEAGGKILCLFRGWNLCRPPFCSQDTILTELPQLSYTYIPNT